MIKKKDISVELEKIFNREYESFCYQNCIREILNFYNCKEYDFYINMSLSTLMFRKEKEYFIRYNKNAHGVLPSMSDKVFCIDDERDCESTFAENVQRIEEGYPIIVCVDGYYLEYFPFYKKRHCKHYMILTGESNDDYVTVLDWYPPHFYCGKVARGEFLMARESSNPNDGSVYSGCPIRNNWTWIKRDGWNRNVGELIYENLDISLKQYFLKSCIDDEVIIGITVFWKIKAELEKIIFLEAEVRRKELKNIHTKLFQSVKRKHLFLYFLKLIQQRIEGNNLINSAVEYLQQLVIQWEKFMTILLKSSFRGRESDILKLVDILKSIINMEEDLYDYVLRLRNLV